MARIAFVGNCQIQAVCNAYNNFVAPWTGDTTSFVDAYKTTQDGAESILKQADVLVGQIAEFKSNIDIDTVPSSAPRYRIPVVAGGFLWPFGGQAHPNNVKRPYMPLGPYPDEIGDSYLNRLIKKNVEPDEIIRKYLDLDINKVVNLDRLFELTLEKQRNRDRATGFETAEFIERHFRDEQLFLTPFHPEIRLARYLIQQSFRTMGVDQAAIGRVEAQLTITPFPKHAAPIHPSVARHFGLTYASRETRYRFYNEGKFTFEQYVGRYVRFEWNEPLEEGVALSHKRMNAAAVERLTVGLRHSPEAALGFSALSGALDRMGRFREATEAARKAAELEPDNALILRHLGVLLGRSGLDQEAELMLSRAIELSPGSAELYIALSQVLRRRRRLQEAVGAAWRAIEIEPKNLGFRTHLSSLIEAEGNLEEAEKMLREALGLAPDSVHCLGALARFLLRQNRFDEAFATATRAEEIEPENAAIIGLLGLLLSRVGKLFEAEMMFRRAIGLSPSSTGLYGDLSHVLERQNRRYEAIGILRDVVSRGSSDPHIHARLGHLLQQCGELAAAEQEFRTALKAGPNVPGYRTSLADVLNRQGKREEAILILREFVADGMNEPQIHGRLGHLLLQAQDFQGAEQEFRAAIAMTDDNASFRAPLAEVLRRQGRRDEAAALL